MNHGFFSLGRLSQERLTRFVLVGIMGWSSFVLGCVPSKVQVQSAPQFDPSTISSLAILPFQALQVPQGGYGQTREGVRDPEEIRTQFRLPGADQSRLSDSQHDRYSVSEAAAQYITTRVEFVLRTRPALRVIREGAVAPDTPLGDDPTGASLRALAKEVGDRLNVDGVMMGLVRTYREREGTRMGAKPAAVGFEMYLVQPSDGTVLWKGEFFEEQKPLTQDVVGFFEKGGGFVTARELAALGVKKVLETFPVGETASSAR